jgi:hypothetical protein
VCQGICRSALGYLRHEERDRLPHKWAFSEAAVLFLRNHPAGQQWLARKEKQQDQGKALTIVAHKLARAVYDLLKRETAFDMNKFLHQ